MPPLDWLLANTSNLLIVLANLALTFITLVSSLFTKRMLRLSSEPIIRIRPEDISITPDLPDTLKLGDEPDDLGDRRICLVIDCSVANLSAHAAQDILLDAEAEFKTAVAGGHNSLPLHRPFYCAFLEGNQRLGGGDIKFSACFDNFVARLILRDFFRGRASFEGMPVLPTKNEMLQRKLWPSPRIILRCFYVDIQGHHYVSEIQKFFHIWRDAEHKKLDVYLLNYSEIEFLGIRRVSRRCRRKYEERMRGKRHTAFCGESLPTRDTLVLLTRRPPSR